MAKLGVHSVEEMCGRTDLLKLKDKQGFKRAGLVDMSRVLAGVAEDSEWKKDRSLFDFKLEKTVDEKTLLSWLEKADSTAKTSAIPIQSIDRTAGTILGSEIQKRFGNTLADDTYCVEFEGGAGQSFGAFIPRGLTLRLTGDANDAFGKA